MFKNLNNITINMNELILVDDWDYLKQALEKYENYTINNKRALKNFLVWVFIKDRTSALPKRYKDARQDFDKVSLVS